MKNSKKAWNLKQLRQSWKSIVQYTRVVWIVLALILFSIPPAVFECHYSICVVFRQKCSKVSVYSHNRFSIVRKPLTDEKDFEFREDMKVQGSQIWQKKVDVLLQFLQFSHRQDTFVGILMKMFFFCMSALVLRIFASSFVGKLE